VLILEKLDKAKKELNYMKEMLSKKNDEGTDNTGGTMKLLEDGADTLEKEISLNWPLDNKNCYPA